MTDITEDSFNNPISFRTRDLNMAAFLFLQDTAEVKELQSTSTGDTIFFVFNLHITESELAQLQLDYANGKTRVEPLAYNERLNRLRDLLHSHKRSRSRSIK